MKSLIVALSLVLALPALAEEPATMVLTGSGQVSVTPDMATIRVGVVTDGAAAAEALARNSAALARVVEVLDAAGLQDGDIQTTRFEVQPIWSNRSYDSADPAEITGYEVTNALSVRVHELDRLGEVLDAVARAGANEFGGISFGLSDPAPLEQEARRAAVRDAQERAALYAEAAGVEILGVLSIAEGRAAVPIARSEVMAVSAAPVPVSEGEVTVSAQVTITYEIDG